jgi:hypothetical protein
MARQAIAPAPLEIDGPHWLFAVHFGMDVHGNIGGTLFRHATIVEDFILAGGTLPPEPPAKTMAEALGWPPPLPRLCE